MGDDEHLSSPTLRGNLDAAGSVRGISSGHDKFGGDAATSIGDPATLIRQANNAASRASQSGRPVEGSVAGLGHDAHTGNFGGGTFVFKADIGQDVVGDFHANTSTGHADVLELTTFHIASYLALLSNTPAVSESDVVTMETHALPLHGMHTAEHHASLLLL